jgi:hypothetical protein
MENEDAIADCANGSLLTFRDDHFLRPTARNFLFSHEAGTNAALDHYLTDCEIRRPYPRVLETLTGAT